MFMNFYKCPCGNSWCSSWECTCDERCPACHKEIEPYHSEDVKEPVEVVEMIVSSTFFAIYVIRLLMESKVTGFKADPTADDHWRIVFEAKHAEFIKKRAQIHLNAFCKDRAYYREDYSTAFGEKQ